MTTTNLPQVLESGSGRYAGVCTGCVAVVSKVWGWRKVNIRSNMVDEMRQFDRPPPPLEYHTRAFWIDVSVDIQCEVEGGFAGNGRGENIPENADAGTNGVGEIRVGGATHAPVSTSGPSEHQMAVKLELPPQHDFDGGFDSDPDHDPHRCPHDHGHGYDHGHDHDHDYGHDHGHGQGGLQNDRDCDHYTEKHKQQRQQHYARVDHNFIAAVHALNHVLAAVAPLFVSCDPQDIDTEHVYPYQSRPRPPRVILFDKRPGGVGVAEALYQHSDAVLAKAEEVISSCPCRRGCPSCIFHNGCSNYNTVLNKRGALVIVRRLLERAGYECRSNPSQTTAGAAAACGATGVAAPITATRPAATKATDQKKRPAREVEEEAIAALHQNASPGRRNRMKVARSMDSSIVRKKLQGPWM